MGPKMAVKFLRSKKALDDIWATGGLGDTVYVRKFTTKHDDSDESFERFEGIAPDDVGDVLYFEGHAGGLRIDRGWGDRPVDYAEPPLWIEAHVLARLAHIAQQCIERQDERDEKAQLDGAN